MARDYADARAELERMLQARALVLHQLQTVGQRIEQRALAYVLNRTRVARLQYFSGGPNSMWGCREYRLQKEGRAQAALALRPERLALLAKLERQDKAIDALARRWGFNDVPARHPAPLQSS